jgi:N-acetylglutamate synthase-like GNAT family acetyltransferase
MITLPQTDAEILECLPVLLQLRPHLQAASFVAQIRQQADRGYQLAALRANGNAIAVAGFHITTNLAWGKHLYLEDLVVDADHRSERYGEQIFQWLIDYAKQHQCDQLHLDSGVQRFAAHRFAAADEYHQPSFCDRAVRLRTMGGVPIGGSG